MASILLRCAALSDAVHRHVCRDGAGLSRVVLEYSALDGGLMRVQCDEWVQEPGNSAGGTGTTGQ
jgi:hypothetical protein